MKRANILATFTALILPVVSMAATMIEAQDGQGNLSKIYLQGDKARIEMPDNKDFVIMDIRNQTMQFVMHDQRMVLNMNPPIKKQNNKSLKTNKNQDNSYLKSKGPGPKIAGYTTEEQEIYAKGQYCGSVFISARAMNEPDIKHFSRALIDIEEQMQNNMTGMRAEQMMDPCSQAENKLMNKLMNIGFPLKSIDGNRRVETVITRLVQNAKLPANAFKSLKIIKPVTQGK